MLICASFALLQLLYPLISSLLHSANSAIDEIMEAREAAEAAHSKMLAAVAQAKAAAAAAASQPPPLPLPPPRAPLEPLPQAKVAAPAPAPLPVHPGVAMRAEFEAKWAAASQARAVAWAAHRQRRHLVSSFAQWRDATLSSRALHIAWLRVAQRRVKRLGRSALTAWRDVARAQATAAAAHDARSQLLVAQEADGSDDDLVLVTPGQAHRALMARRRARSMQVDRQRACLLAWRDWARRNMRLDKLRAAHVARGRARTTRAVFTALRAYAQRKKQQAALVDASLKRAKRRVALRLLRAWFATASEEIHARRMTQYVHVSDAVALMAQQRHVTGDGTPRGILGSALTAWHGAVRWRRRAAFLVDRSRARRSEVTLRSVVHAWAALAAEGVATKRQWETIHAQQAGDALRAAFAAWRHVTVAGKHHDRALTHQAWTAWCEETREARAEALASVASHRAASSVVASAFRGWRTAAGRLEMQEVLLRAASAAVRRHTLRCVFADWRGLVVESRLGTDADDVATRVRDALVRLSSAGAVPHGETEAGQPAMLTASPADLRAALAVALRDTVYRRFGGEAGGGGAAQEAAAVYPLALQFETPGRPQ